MLFLLYINDINNAITSQIKLFSDDSVLLRTLSSDSVLSDDSSIIAWAPLLHGIFQLTTDENLEIFYFDQLTQNQVMSQV